MTTKTMPERQRKPSACEQHAFTPQGEKKKISDAAMNR